MNYGKIKLDRPGRKIVRGDAQADRESLAWLIVGIVTIIVAGFYA